MKLESIGIIIALRPFGERDMVAHIFTRDYGVMVGMMRGAAVARKNRPLVGQMGVVSWNARLDSALGVFHFESSRNLSAPLMSNASALAYMNSAFALLHAMLPERERYECLYNSTLEFLTTGDYLPWEIFLLRELGYALDLSRCSNCGTAENLTHLSRRTGRAVCTECATPWVDKCFALPIDLNVTKFFVERAAADMGTEIPMMRKMI
ncbi:MAG: DNA repair protein RecO [Alphaproteobacteria bacterium]|nr:DNA repair protein RecO [Alphaproteobacteria bacterium]MCL2890065.1 DNA repair protein RecO [Alphaproteobacteria bacterium]